MVSAEAYLAVADELAAKARTLRLQALKEPPRSRNTLRMQAAKLERAARLLIEEADR
jgi:hypothetical protein